jgi:hypothetical protein
MSEHRSLYRIVAYLVVIAILSYPVYYLGHPASIDSSGERSPGGKLAQLRDEYHLSQATLGEIDPTSQTMALATLGMRGAAVVLLWDAAHKYQMREDWSSLKPVVDQITRLQPNFWSIWDFQAHNLTYNISVEFDDYRDRFYWVMEGITKLKEGLKYNDTDPRFLARIGWFYGNKIGKADEHLQYRKLFKKQQEEKGEKLTDNWLVSNDWYRRAQDLVDFSSRPLRVYISGEQESRRNKPGERAPSPLLFHSEAAMALINYAETLEEEPADEHDEHFVDKDKAKAAWESAAAEWDKYSQRDISTSYNYTVRLADLEELKALLENKQKELEKLLPGEKERAKEAKRAKLSDAERAALDKKPSERTTEERDQVSAAEGKIDVTWDEVALRAPPELRNQARELADEIAELRQKTSTIDTYRDIVNYNYWLARCQSEPTDECLEARKLLFDASQAYEVQGSLFDARDSYDKAFAKWRIVLDKFPVLRSNNIMADELVDEINKYKKILGKIAGAKVPSPFILQDMIDLNEGKRPATEAKSEAKPSQPQETAEEAKESQK